MIAHPLTGIKPWHKVPPSNWSLEQIEALQRPYGQSAVSVADLKAHGTFAYRTLKDLTPFYVGDIASLAPYRARAAWRMTRAMLIGAKVMSSADSVACVPIDVLAKYSPPPPPDDLDDYDPTEDKPLLKWIANLHRMVTEAHLEAGTAHDPHYGRNQTSAIRNPHFARAAWPSWFDILAAETAMVEEVIDELSKGGPAQALTKLHARHNILALEAKSIVRMSAQALKELYRLLPSEDMKALYAHRVDDIIRRAREDYKINAEISATKLGALLHGAIAQEQRDTMDDVMDSIVDAKDLTDADIEAIAPRSQDPLLLDQKDPTDD